MGGLANRMRFIASAIWLKEQLDTRLTVIWNENYELNCPYNQLFETAEAFQVKPVSRMNGYIKSTNQAVGIQQSLINITNNLLGINYCITEPDFHNLVWTGKLDILETARRHKNIYIKTCQEFGDNQFAFKYFVPIAPLQEKVDTIIDNYSAHVVGVHIRRTDNEMSISNSPVGLFVDKMKDELQLNNETCFFLCTDDAEVETMMMQQFGNKIITYKKELSRQSIKGMQDALVDLYCLSKTAKILGSYWSSFSEIGARINNIPLQIVKNGQ